MEKNTQNTNNSEVENALSLDARDSKNDGLGLPVMDTDHGQTHFIAPGAMQDLGVYARPNFHDVPTDNELKNYLSRPIIRNSGNFTAGSENPVYIEYFTANSFVVPNLSGAFGYRATACFRLEVTAAPQAQGILRMAYEYLPPTGSTSKIGARPIIAQLPGSEINLRNSSAMEIRVPYVSDRDFWPLVNGNYASGTRNYAVAVFPYAPVDWDTTTVSTPSWVLYGWLEDVELVGKTATLVNVTPQSGETIGKGLVTSWFNAASKVATYAASVPLLSSYMSPLSWVISAAAKVSAHYGWSKPANSSYTGCMQMATVRGINTCADQDFTNQMGHYANNEVAVLNGFAGSRVDEMSLCFLTCKPGLICVTKLSATDTKASVKWICPVTPACFVMQGNAAGFSQKTAVYLGSDTPTGPKRGYYPSPIAFCASFF